MVHFLPLVAPVSLREILVIVPRTIDRVIPFSLFRNFDLKIL